MHESSDQRWYLKQWRKHRGLTQAQLADRIDTSTSYVSDLERGAARGGRRYNQDLLEALAFALGIEPWQLLGDDPRTGAGEEATVTNLFDKLNPAQRKQAIAMMEILAGTPANDADEVEAG